MWAIIDVGHVGYHRPCGTCGLSYTLWDKWVIVDLIIHMEIIVDLWDMGVIIDLLGHVGYHRPCGTCGLS